ncbi:hypothetical protein [Xylanivirga thermophila]|jgi:hypothetical protein|uniref:hypothetical protein n=1 Tax=Xylanivirga thermophila TaxID=2496273 RepID=UPI00101D5683|nr:hypothetical protein [Xylanivirga thermophila]
MWIVIYMAQSEDTAKDIQSMLTDEGFLVKSRPIYKNVSEQDNCYEILVPQSEAYEARCILVDKGY